MSEAKRAGRFLPGVHRERLWAVGSHRRSGAAEEQCQMDTLEITLWFWVEIGLEGTGRWEA